MFTLEERDALRFYEGDIRIRNEKGRITMHKAEDQFFGDCEVYRTLNALLFSNIYNEKERILLENHCLNEAVPENIEKVIKLYCEIYTAMCKAIPLHDKVERTKRVERIASLEYLRQGYTMSFTSTSRHSFDSAFAKKNGIILLEFCIPMNVPYVDFNKILGKEYKFNDELEILLPPFIPISIVEGKLSFRDKNIKDMNGNSPLGKYIVNFVEDDKKLKKQKCCEFEKQELEKYIYDKNRCIMAGKALKSMNNGNWKDDFEEYIKWKEVLQQYLKILFEEIYKEASEKSIEK